MYNTGLNYLVFLNYPWVLFYNIFFNLGLVYDSLKNMLTYFFMQSRTSCATPQDLGEQLG